MNKTLKIFLFLSFAFTGKNFINAENTQITILRPSTVNCALKIAANLNEPILGEKIQQNDGLYAIEFIEYLINEAANKSETISDDANQNIEKFCDNAFEDCSYFLRSSKNRIYVETAQQLQIFYNFKVMPSDPKKQIKSFLHKNPLKHFATSFILNLCKIKKSLESGYIGPKYNKTELLKMSEDLKNLFHLLANSQDFQKILKDYPDLTFFKIENSISALESLGLPNDYTTLFKWLTGICATCTIIACVLAITIKSNDPTAKINNLEAHIAAEINKTAIAITTERDATQRALATILAEQRNLTRRLEPVENRLETIEADQISIKRNLDTKLNGDQVDARTKVDEKIAAATDPLNARLEELNTQVGKCFEEFHTELEAIKFLSSKNQPMASSEAPSSDNKIKNTRSRLNPLRYILGENKE